jgi:hypothetical protein
VNEGRQGQLLQALTILGIFSKLFIGASNPVNLKVSFLNTNLKGYRLGEVDFGFFSPSYDEIAF